MRLNYAIVFVSDMKRAVSFYRDVLGLPLKFESPAWTEFATSESVAKEQAARIKELTNGKLQFGMTEGEVIAVLGKPNEHYLAQAVGNFGLTYEGYSLFFRLNRLAEIRKEK